MKKGKKEEYFIEFANSKPAVSVKPQTLTDSIKQYANELVRIKAKTIDRHLEGKIKSG